MKGHRNPRACVCKHAYMHACFMHVYAYTSMCVHARVLETM